MCLVISLIFFNPERVSSFLCFYDVENFDVTLVECPLIWIYHFIVST